jgi:hypothetical protein
MICLRIFHLALLALGGVCIQNAYAGSAVAIGPDGHIAVVGGPYNEEAAKQKALALWHSKHRSEARILASSGAVGECAVAVWRQGKHWAVSASLGKRSEAEAYAIAMRNCLQHCPPGARPKIYRAWRS